MGGGKGERKAKLIGGMQRLRKEREGKKPEREAENSRDRERT